MKATGIVLGSSLALILGTILIWPAGPVVGADPPEPAGALGRAVPRVTVMMEDPLLQRQRERERQRALPVERHDENAAPAPVSPQTEIIRLNGGPAGERVNAGEQFGFRDLTREADADADAVTMTPEARNAQVEALRHQALARKQR